jgi:hypothetical protein
MKPVLLENVISEKELYFIYNEIIGSNGWNVSGITHPVDYPSNKNFLKGPVLLVKNENEPILNYAFYLYGQSLIYKIMNFLSDRKIGMYSKLERIVNDARSKTPKLYEGSRIRELDACGLSLEPMLQGFPSILNYFLQLES